MFPYCRMQNCDEKNTLTVSICRCKSSTVMHFTASSCVLWLVEIVPKKGDGTGYRYRTTILDVAIQLFCERDVRA